MVVVVTKAPIASGAAAVGSPRAECGGVGWVGDCIPARYLLC